MVDLSVVGLLVALRFLALRGVSKAELRTGTRLLHLCGLLTLALNTARVAHIRDSLNPVGLLPRILRSTRLLTLADQLDIKQLTAALRMTYAGAAHYA